MQPEACATKPVAAAACATGFPRLLKIICGFDAHAIQALAGRHLKFARKNTREVARAHVHLGGHLFN
jgi:hypothetical protein